MALVPAFDLAGFERNDIGLGAIFLKRFPGLQQFGLLEAVGS